MEKFDWSKVEFARTRWRSQVIPDALPILIRWAQEGEAHSYSDLAQEIRDNYGRDIKPRKDLYGTVAGGVAQALQWLSEQWGKPREWFLLPLPVIDEALKRIQDGSITDYVYDPAQAMLVRRS